MIKLIGAVLCFLTSFFTASFWRMMLSNVTGEEVGVDDEVFMIPFLFVLT